MAERYVFSVLLLFNCYLLLYYSYNRPRSDRFNGVNTTLLPRGLSSLSNKALIKFTSYFDERLTIEINKTLVEANLKCIHAIERF